MCIDIHAFDYYIQQHTNKSTAKLRIQVLHQVHTVLLPGTNHRPSKCSQTFDSFCPTTAYVCISKKSTARKNIDRHFTGRGLSFGVVPACMYVPTKKNGTTTAATRTSPHTTTTTGYNIPIYMSCAKRIYQHYDGNRHCSTGTTEGPVLLVLCLVYIYIVRTGVHKVFGFFGVLHSLCHVCTTSQP